MPYILWSLEEAAALTGIDLPTLNLRIADGQGPKVLAVESKPFVTTAELKRWTRRLLRIGEAPSKPPAAAKPAPKGMADALLSSAQVREKVGGVSMMCIWRWMRDERMAFPWPLKIGTRNYWRLPEIDAWLLQPHGKAAIPPK